MGRSSSAISADVLHRLADLTAELGDRLPGHRIVDPLFRRLEPERDRGKRLPGLVVELTRQAAPLVLLRCDDALDRVARHALGKVDGDGGARREGLGQPQVVVGEMQPDTGGLVVRGDDADRSVADDQGHPDTRAGREPTVEVAVD